MTRSLTTAGLLLLGAFGTVTTAQAASLTALGYLPGFEHSGYGKLVENDGTVYGFDSKKADGSRPFGEPSSQYFIWSPNTGKLAASFPGLLNLPDRYHSQVTSDRRYSVDSENSLALDSKAYRQLNSDQSRIYLGNLPGYSGSHPYSITDDGRTIVGVSHSSSKQPRAFLWNQGSGMIDLQGALDKAGVDTSHWKTMYLAFSISANGEWVTGRGINQQGKHEAYVANIANISPVPEASSFALFGLGLATVVGVRRRQLKGKTAV